jgi:hypothetical protein
MIRVGSALIKDPMATKWGPETGRQTKHSEMMRSARDSRAVDERRGRTFQILGLSQQQARLFTEYHRTVSRSHHRGTVSQVSFGFVNVVDALATSTGVLRVERVDTVSARSNAEDEGVLKSVEKMSF